MWCIAVQQVSNQLTYEYVSDDFGVVETAQLNDMALGRPSQRALPLGKLPAGVFRYRRDGPDRSRATPISETAGRGFPAFEVVLALLCKTVDRTRRLSVLVK